MPVLAIQGLRGGVGTTSITAALAYALEQLGESALVIDFSPDNLLRLHFNANAEERSGWARRLIDDGEWWQAAFSYPLTNSSSVLNLEPAKLHYLPFGCLSTDELNQLLTRLREEPDWWQRQLARLSADRYRWIILDLPQSPMLLNQQGAQCADHHFCLLMADAASHVLLRQKVLPKSSHFVINQFLAISKLQKDLQLLWSQTLAGLLPMILHRDEALAEALASKQPLGEYAPHSLVAQELTTLANWCLIHCRESD